LLTRDAGAADCGEYRKERPAGTAGPLSFIATLSRIAWLSTSSAIQAEGKVLTPRKVRKQ
jgi:hypothetical protein